ncbi:MAG: enoyl-CoA hydratase/isomerase family protein [Acidimicrobiia bacterium]|nr:MAG: enoyl-CoA hydratase/isomerase family protein [Acidimicrobiia bacterium]
MSVRTEQHDHILVVTIDRPEVRNAINLAMTQTLIEIWRNFAGDPDLRVAILTGTGDRAFCAGADLKEVGTWYASMTPEERRHRAETEPGLGGITRNLDPGKPIIAAINGICFAGGLEMALACDIRIAAEHATFGLPEVKWGLMPGAGGTQRLPATTADSTAMEMLLTGDPIGAERALRSGLISTVVPASELMATAMDVATRIARNAPLATRAVRRAARQGRHVTIDEGLRLEHQIAEPLRQTDDVQEGLRAFREKRTPQFKGR